jgi:hypothetical protein
VDRLCYSISARGAEWVISTPAPWPNALAQEFSNREEAIVIATIAARLEWEHTGTATCVCVRDRAAGNKTVECTFG